MRLHRRFPILPSLAWPASAPCLLRFRDPTIPDHESSSTASHPLLAIISPLSLLLGQVICQLLSSSFFFRYTCFMIWAINFPGKPPNFPKSLQVPPFFFLPTCHVRSTIIFFILSAQGGPRAPTFPGLFSPSPCCPSGQPGPFTLRSFLFLAFGEKKVIFHC